MTEFPPLTTGTKRVDDEGNVTFDYASVGENPEWHKPDALGFVGVSPEYANYANDTDEPLVGDEDVPEGEPETALQKVLQEVAKEVEDEESSSGGGGNPPPSPPPSSDE